MCPIQLAVHLFIACRIFLSTLILCTTSSFFMDRCSWSSPSFSSTTFQNFPGIPDLFSGVSKLYHYTKLCSKCKTLHVNKGEKETVPISYKNKLMLAYIIHSAVLPHCYSKMFWILHLVYNFLSWLWKYIIHTPWRWPFEGRNMLESQSANKVVWHCV